MTLTFTTNLPEVYISSITTEDNGNITMEISGSTNYGDYLIEWKEKSASTWNTMTVARSTTTTTIPTDYYTQAYDLRLRSETEDTENPWQTDLRYALLRKYNGTSWVFCPVKWYDGQNWIPVNSVSTNSNGSWVNS